MNPTKFFPKLFSLAGGTSIGGTKMVEEDLTDETIPEGEDLTAFELGEQKVSLWIYFTIILGSVLFALHALWLSPSTGYRTAFVDALSGLTKTAFVGDAPVAAPVTDWTTDGSFRLSSIRSNQNPFHLAQFPQM